MRLLFLLLVLIGCGTQEIEAVHGTTIIAGQSNARELLRVAISSQPIDPLLISSGRYIGYGVGSTSINWWKNNVEPLKELVSENCAQETRLVWYQGESDLNNSRFEQDTLQFLQEIQATCTLMKILVVVVGPSVSLDYSKVQAAQRRLPYRKIEPASWKPVLIDSVHYTDSSYKRLLEVVNRY